MGLEKAKLCDAVLDKFRGDASFTWDEMHNEAFFKSIDDSYFVVENTLKFLLSKEENCLEEKLFYDAIVRVCLSPKGFGILGDISQNYTSLSNEKEENKKIANNAVFWAKWAAILAGIGILLSVVIEIYHSYKAH